jgi:hypothetical protein
MARKLLEGGSARRLLVGRILAPSDYHGRNAAGGARMRRSAFGFGMKGFE